MNLKIKKIWHNIRHNLKKCSSSARSPRLSVADSGNSPASLKDHIVGAIEPTASTLVSALTGFLTDSRLQDPSNTQVVGTPAPDENTPGWKTTAYSGVKMALEVVRESSDVFVPFKSAVGGLSALLKQYDVGLPYWKTGSWLIIYGVMESNSSPTRRT